MARNFTRGDRVAVSAAWADLAVQLNSVGPPIKNADKWRNRESKATGGGPFNQVALNPTEEEIAQLCHMCETVDGVAGARTFGILLPNNEKENDVEEEAVEVKEELGFEPRSPVSLADHLSPPPRHILF
ncbi:hypothetical protein ACLKA6_016216 [Drosophila palustris]